MKILNVDDNPAQRTAVTGILASAGFTVHEAATGNEAISVARTWAPDIALVNTHLPDIDGLELCRRLKAHNTVVRLSVILIFHDDQAGEVTAEADAYIVRPISERTLKATIHSVERLRAAEAARDLAAAELATKTADISRQIAERRYLSAIVESSDDAIIGKSLEGIITSWNRGAERLYGYMADEIIGKPIATLVPPDYPDETPELMKRASAGEHIERYVTVRRQRDGARIQVSLTLSPIRDDAGQLLGFSTIARDVTRERRTQEQLRISEERFRSLYENAAVGIEQVAVDGTLLTVNAALCQMLGYSEPELLARTFEEITHPDDLAEETALLDSMFRGERENYQMGKRYLRNDGQPVWVHLTSSLVRDEAGEPSYRISVVQDISARKQAEEALQHQHSLTQAITNTAADALFMTDSHGRITFMNPAAEQMFGYSAAELMGASLHDAIHYRHPEGGAYPITECPFVPAYAGKKILHDFEDVFFAKADRPVQVACSTAPLIRDGRVTASVLVVRDITERKRAERAVRENEQRFRALTENIPQLVWTSDGNGKCDYVSNRWLRYTGTTLQENLGFGWYDCLHPDDREKTRGAWRTALATGGAYEVEYRLRNAFGSYEWHLAQGVRMEGGDGAGRWAGTSTNIEEMKQTQELLMRSEKLASVGRMAATIAHEINNPLEAVMNAVYLAWSDSSLSPEARAQLDLAEQELERVAHITRQTLGFYREVGRAVETDLCVLIDDVVDLYAPRLKNKNITVTRRYTSCTIEVVPGEMRQVISNLIANSIDAIPAGGKLEIRVASMRGANGDRMVRLTVADTGSGIAPENLHRLFEPFFTTKQAIGTGLGLWVTREIVKKHNGSIRLRSRAGRGTVITISLPEVARSQSSAAD